MPSQTRIKELELGITMERDVWFLLQKRNFVRALKDHVDKYQPGATFSEVFKCSCCD
jgi:hypothetical protein